MHSDPVLQAACPSSVDTDVETATAAGFVLRTSHMYTHVAHCSLRPFRPVLSELQTLDTDTGANDDDDDDEDADDPTILTAVQARQDTGTAKISTLAEVCAELH